MALSDMSGIIPLQYSQQIIQEVIQTSAALRLGTRLPMGTKITHLPVPTAFPTASWVTTPPGPPATATGRKPYTDLKIEPQIITAEEVAAVVAVPDIYLEDNTINLWSFIRPQLAQAIAIAIDQAVFFGGGPASFPTGGLASNTYSTAVPNAIDAVDAVNLAMGLVEGRGLAVTGHAADLVVKSALRGVRDENGSLLLGENRAVGERALPTLYGEQIEYTSFAQITAVDFFTGAWQYLIMGVRQDIRFVMDPSGVITNDAGTTVLVSGFQDNVTPMKVWARIGCTIVRPATPRAPSGPKVPFARAKLVGIGPLPEGASPPPPPDEEHEPGEDDGETRSARSTSKK